MQKRGKKRTGKQNKRRPQLHCDEKCTRRGESPIEFVIVNLVLATLRNSCLFTLLLDHSQACCGCHWGHGDYLTIIDRIVRDWGNQGTKKRSSCVEE